jgi:hypothetical protein
MSIKNCAQTKRLLTSKLGKDTKISNKDLNQERSYQMFTQCHNK